MDDLDQGPLISGPCLDLVTYESVVLQTFAPNSKIRVDGSSILSVALKLSTFAKELTLESNTVGFLTPSRHRRSEDE